MGYLRYRTSHDVLVLAHHGSRFFKESADGLAAMLRSIGLRASSALLEGKGWEDRARAAVLAVRPALCVTVNMTRLTLPRALEDAPAVACWRQDDCSETDSPARRDAWIERCAPRGDYVFGYAGACRNAGWPEDRLIETPLFTDPERMTLPEGESTTPAPPDRLDLLLATDKGGDPLTWWGANRSALGLDLPAGRLRDFLTERYSSGLALRSFGELERVCDSERGLEPVAEAMRRSGALRILLYWHFAERVHRCVVASWMSKATPRWALSGAAWPEPRTELERASHLPGRLQGPVLGAWRARSKWSLHVNGMGGMHHNITEIILAGGRPLLRAPPGGTRLEPSPELPSREALAERQRVLLRRAFATMLDGHPGYIGDDMGDLAGTPAAFSSEDDLARFSNALENPNP